jgi:hopene-associated glycosyltransferase HpnB
MIGTAAVTGVSLLALAVWAGLLFARGGFWRCNERDDRTPIAEPSRWPSIVAIVPARDEADMLPRSLPSLLGQDYPGPFSVILVDDHSDDETLAIAQHLAAGAAGRLAVLEGAPPPPRWTGKLWALSQGVEKAQASSLANSPDYLLLTDADIGYQPGALRTLAARAESGSFALVSLMAKLRCRSLAERALIPAFVFFFQMLYPFAWVNRGKTTAAAAGGCMLVRRTALADAGGIASIRGALIDDCALGARLKQHGPVWLGLTERVESLRAYPSVGDIRRMVARSAYAQLRFSPLLLAATLAGLALAYLAAPVIALFGSGSARGMAWVTWAMMAVAFRPALRFFRVSAWWAPALPLIAAAYFGFTLDSAFQHARGRGGLWKGRVQALAAEEK